MTGHRAMNSTAAAVTAGSAPSTTSQKAAPPVHSTGSTDPLHFPGGGVVGLAVGLAVGSVVGAGVGSEVGEGVGSADGRGVGSAGQLSHSTGHAVSTAGLTAQLSLFDSWHSMGSSSPWQRTLLQTCWGQ